MSFIYKVGETENENETKRKKERNVQGRLVDYDNFVKWVTWNVKGFNIKVEQERQIKKLSF